MANKVEGLTLGLVAVCLLLGPIYVLTMGLTALAFLSALFSGNPTDFYSGIFFLLAFVLLTVLIAGLYHRNRIALVAFVLLLPLYVSVGIPSSSDNQLHYLPIMQVLVICGLTVVAAALYARELKLR